MGIYINNKRFLEKAYELESELERDVVNNSNLFFGTNSIYIDAKRKIEAKTLGGTIPDGFLFDFSDSRNPILYIVEAELSKHDFFGHIVPQITKFIAFFNNKKSQNDLVNKLYNLIVEDIDIKSKFEPFLANQELYKFIKDTVENSQNILLIIDGEKKELPNIMETYTEWGQMVKLLVLKRYSSGEDVVFSLEPEFENVEYSVLSLEEKATSDVVKEYTETMHTDPTNENVKQIYFDLKDRILSKFPESVFNATKKYISVVGEKRVAHFRFRKKSLLVVLMNGEEAVKKVLIHHKVKTLADGVKKFWNGDCCEVQLIEPKHLDEVANAIINLLE